VRENCEKALPAPRLRPFPAKSLTVRPPLNRLLTGGAVAVHGREDDNSSRYKVAKDWARAPGYFMVSGRLLSDIRPWRLPRVRNPSYAFFLTKSVRS